MSLFCLLDTEEEDKLDDNIWDDCVVPDAGSGGVSSTGFDLADFSAATLKFSKSGFKESKHSSEGGGAFGMTQYRTSMLTTISIRTTRMSTSPSPTALTPISQYPTRL